MTLSLSFSEHAPVGKVVTALERLDPSLARGVEHTLDDDDNAFVVFDTTTPAGRFVDALIELVDERVRMAQAAETEAAHRLIAELDRRHPTL